jgi:Skp family chaperone for outer membrane proteins
MEQKELFNKIEELMASGDLEKTKNFLIENFSQLPKELQRKTASFLLENGLEKESQKKATNFEKKVTEFEALNNAFKKGLAQQGDL